MRHFSIKKSVSHPYITERIATIPMGFRGAGQKYKSLIGWAFVRSPHADGTRKKDNGRIMGRIAG